MLLIVTFVEGSFFGNRCNLGVNVCYHLICALYQRKAYRKPVYTQHFMTDL